MNILDMAKKLRGSRIITAAVVVCAVAGAAVGCNLSERNPDAATSGNETQDMTDRADELNTDYGVDEITDGDYKTQVLYALDSPFTDIEDGANFDAEAFAEYLGEYIDANIKQYYKTGEQLTARITNLYVSNEGAVSLNGLELHSGDIYHGFNAGTLCGSMLIFFSYSPDKPTEFEKLESIFDDDGGIQQFYEPSGNTFCDYTLTVDAQNRLRLVKAGEPDIITPADYYGGAGGVEEFTRFETCNYSGIKENNEIMLIAHQERTWDTYAYKSFDNGLSWSESKLELVSRTPGDNTIFPAEDVIISRIDDADYRIMLCTARAEVFIFDSRDAGVTFEQICSFRLKNYEIPALEAGAFTAPGDIGFMCFLPLDGVADPKHAGKPNPNIYMTRDGGYNWELMEIAPPEGYPVDWQATGGTPYLSDGKIIIPIYIDEQTFLYVSADNGETWTYDYDAGAVDENGNSTEAYAAIAALPLVYTECEVSLPDIVADDNISATYTRTTVSGTDIVIYETTDGLLCAGYVNADGKYERFLCMNEEGETIPLSYMIDEYKDIFGKSGFTVTWGWTHIFTNYYYFDTDGAPKLLLVAYSSISAADVDGDGEDELVSEWMGRVDIYSMKDGKLFSATLNESLADTDFGKYITYLPDENEFRIISTDTQNNDEYRAYIKNGNLYICE